MNTVEEIYENLVIYDQQTDYTGKRNMEYCLYRVNELFSELCHADFSSLNITAMVGRHQCHELVQILDI